MPNLDRIETVIETVEHYLEDLNNQPDEAKQGRVIDAMLPLMLLDLDSIADNISHINDLDIKSRFTSVANELIQQEETYDPNPGKTRNSVSGIKEGLLKLEEGQDLPSLIL